MDLILALLKLYQDQNIQKKLKLYSDQDKKETTLYRKVIDILRTNPEIEENQLINILYGKSKYKAKSFSKLKERLIGKLINVVLIVDAKEFGFTELYQTYIQLNKNVLIGRILTSSGSSEIGNEIIDKTMKLALKYEFTDLQLLISRLQASHYGNIMQDSKM